VINHWLSPPDSPMPSCSSASGISNMVRYGIDLGDAQSISWQQGVRAPRSNTGLDLSPEKKWWVKWAEKSGDLLWGHEGEVMRRVGGAGEQLLSWALRRASCVTALTAETAVRSQAGLWWTKCQRDGFVS